MKSESSKTNFGILGFFLVIFLLLFRLCKVLGIVGGLVLFGSIMFGSFVIQEVTEEKEEIYAAKIRPYEKYMLNFGERSSDSLRSRKRFMEKNGFDWTDEGQYLDHFNSLTDYGQRELKKEDVHEHFSYHTYSTKERFDEYVKLKKEFDKLEAQKNKPKKEWVEKEKNNKENIYPKESWKEAMNKNSNLILWYWMVSLFASFFTFKLLGFES